MEWFKDEINRAWLYRVFLMIIVVAGAFNIVVLSDSQQEALGDLVQLLILGFPVGLAVRNTSTK